MTGDLRRAGEADAEPLAALVNASFSVERFFKRGDRTSAAGVAAMMRDGYFLVAGRQTELAGAIFVRPTQPHGYFGMLSVAPAMQGRGLGRRLVDAAERDLALAGCTHAEIHVVNLREELPPFYRRLGYDVVGERPFPDPAEATQPCHMIVMRKRLSQAPAG
jgi:ribosomal protein S18 acetylase RimI-like enzyme